MVVRSRDRFPVMSLGIFSVVPPIEPCALRSTQPLKVSTRDFSWGKGGRCVWSTTYHHGSAETSSKFGALNYPESLGPPRLVAGDLHFFLDPYRIKKSKWIWKSSHFGENNEQNHGKVYITNKAQYNI